MDWLIFSGFLLALLLIFIAKATRVFQNYKGKIYPQLYSGFLEYYYKYRYKKNLSVSHWLDQEIGPHRILFNSYLNDDKQVIHDFVTIFHEKGILVCCIIPSKGVLSGQDSDKYWIISRDQKNYRITNPIRTIRQHAAYIAEQFADPEAVECCLLFPQETDITKLHTDVLTGRYPDLLNMLQKQNQSVSFEAILQAFKLWNKH